MVTPDTVLRWHRRRFRDYWASLSTRPLVGRPSVNAEIIALVRKMWPRSAIPPMWKQPGSTTGARWPRLTSGMRPLIAHCHLGLGKLYRRTGKRQDAQEHLTTATTMYREMDMHFYLEQTEGEMVHLT
jgi:hypothetical protein